MVAPWFIYVAQVTDRVYRLGTPGWTLGADRPRAAGRRSVAAVLVESARDAERGEGLADRLEGRGRTWLVVGLTAPGSSA